MYKQIKDFLGNIRNDQILRVADNAYIPFDSANTDYQVFKADLAKGVELQNANGVAMTADQIKTFLAGLA
jgi:hypothetical protein